MINYTEIPNPDDRLNSILDKISRFGIRNLKKEEIYFLDSYSIGKELEINKKLSEEESSNLFISDDGNFTFKLENIERDLENSVKYINGK